MSEDAEYVCQLPDSKQPWMLMQFRNRLVACNEDKGCYIFDDDGQWKQCVPASSDPLVYHQSWFYNA